MSDKPTSSVTAERRGAPRWCSNAVRLAVLGTAGTTLAAALGGCSRVGYQRNVYRDKLDCAADYSGDICRAKGSADKDTYLGPVYRTSGGTPEGCTTEDPGAGRTTVDDNAAPDLQRAMLRRSVLKVERGGFGTAAVACDQRARHGYSGRGVRRWWGFGG